VLCSVTLGLASVLGCGSAEQVVLGYGASPPGAADAAAESEASVNPAGRVLGFELVDVNTGADLRGLADGDTINLNGGTGGGPVNLRAVVDPTVVGSVEFAVDGHTVRVEESAPYAIAGNDPNTGKYFVWTIAAGTHAIKATPYSARHAAGVAGGALQQTFQIQ
jgi:hypothetical protein